MEFEWDEAKRLINLEKHGGIDFYLAMDLFDGRPIFEDKSPSEGEVRLLRTGIIGGKFVTVVWTMRANKVRIISARIARHADRRAYRELYGG